MPAPADDEPGYRTRRKRIDPRLAAFGWKVVTDDAATPRAACARHSVTEFPTDNGPADYVLFVGIDEAKADFFPCPAGGCDNRCHTASGRI